MTHTRRGGPRRFVEDTMSKETLARVVCDLLELPYHRRSGKGYDIVGAVLTALKEALQRGERVWVKGWGILYVRTRRIKNNQVIHFFQENRRGVMDVPAKRIVTFKPAKPLLRMLNE